MLESSLSNQCKKYFASLGSKCVAIKKHQSGYSGRRGISDWLICYKGRFIAIELKVGNNTATDLQKEFLDEVRAAGGYAAVCYFLDEVKEVIRKIDEKDKLMAEWLQHTEYKE